MSRMPGQIFFKRLGEDLGFKARQGFWDRSMLVMSEKDTNVFVAREHSSFKEQGLPGTLATLWTDVCALYANVTLFAAEDHRGSKGCKGLAQG